jgi:hypothetical protein
MLQAPALLHSALLTDDLLLQRDTASASILDSTERAELDGAPWKWHGFGAPWIVRHSVPVSL